MTLFHLLLVIIPLGLFSALLPWLLHANASDGNLLLLYSGLLLLFFVVTLQFAWLICRKFGMPPLMFLSGPCPKCNTRPPGWHCLKREEHWVKLSCGNCGAQLELWLTRKPPLEQVSLSVPSFALRWPEFLGRWRALTAVPRHGRKAQ